MVEEIVYLNGNLLPRPRACVSVYDQGFLYGYGLFETMRAYKGKIFLLDRHLRRLQSSAEYLGFGEALAPYDLRKACRDVLAINNLGEARLRLTVTRGEIDSFPGSGAGTAPTVLVTARPYSPLPEEVYQKGFRAVISTYQRCRNSLLARLKSTSYLTSILARMEAEATGFNEALLLNEDGFLAEGSTSNLFLIEGNQLVTPPLASGLLPGITREVVIELAGTMGTKVRETEVRAEDIGGYGEAFLTNSVMEIMPLVSVQFKGDLFTIGTGEPGAVTRKLRVAYRDMVKRETLPQG